MLFEGEALPHFNEVDECAGLDGLVTYRLWRELGFEPENTLHDLRWGERPYGTATITSGSSRFPAPAPPAHFIGGWNGAISERQPPMYFRLGGGTIKGISKPGEIVWSRVFIEDGKLKIDLGRAEVRRTAAGRNRAPLADHDAAMADHARGDLWRLARPDDGPAQSESHPGRVCARRRAARTSRSRPKPRRFAGWDSKCHLRT